MIDLKTVFPLRRDDAIVFEECLDRGLIDPATLKLTEAGARSGPERARSEQLRDRFASAGCRS